MSKKKLKITQVAMSEGFLTEVLDVMAEHSKYSMMNMDMSINFAQDCLEKLPSDFEQLSDEARRMVISNLLI